MKQNLDINVLHNKIIENNNSLHDLYLLKDKIYNYKIKNNLDKNKKIIIENIDKHIDYKIDKIQNKKETILTIITTIFLPLGFIVGFFGMNFKSIGIPNLKKALYIVVSLCLLSIIFILFFFYYHTYYDKH